MLNENLVIIVNMLMFSCVESATVMPPSLPC